MATAELVILSSSPNDIPRRHIYSVPTSPDRSAAAIAQKHPHRPVLKSGSRAGQIPVNASAGFRSASLLAKDNGIDCDTQREEIPNSALVSGNADDEQNSDDQNVNDANLRKRENGTNGMQDPDLELDIKPTPRKPRKTEAKDRDLNEKSLKTKELGKAPKQTKSKKKKITPTNLEQTQLEKGTITKPNVVDLPSKTFQFPPGVNYTSNLSNHFPVNQPKVDVMSNHRQALALPKKSAKSCSEAFGSDSGKENVERDAGRQPAPVDVPKLSKDASSRPEADAGRPDDTTPQENITEQSRSRAEERQHAPKRRRVEASKSTSPAKKTKQPSKSSRTVTSIALRAFVQPEDEPITEAAITEFLPPPIPPEEKDDASKKTRKRSKSPKKIQDRTKTKTAAKPSNKSGVHPTNLLSPTAAKRKLGRQDFLFGTSSQLVLDESPASLLELQQVLNASADQASQPEVNGAAPDDVRLVRGRRGLWLSGTRSRIEDEKTAELYDPADFEPKVLPEDTTVPAASSDFMDIDALNTSSPCNVSIAPVTLPSSSPPVPTPLLQESQPQMSRLRLASLQSVRPKSTLRCAIDEEMNIDDTRPIKDDQGLKLPATGSKVLGIAQSETKDKEPPKKRPRKKISPVGETTAPKKPRGRPRKNLDDKERSKTPRRSKKIRSTLDDKDKTAAEADDFTPIDEISDHEPCPTPSPPRRSGPATIKELELLPMDFPAMAPSKKSFPVPHIPSKPYQDELFPHLKTYLFKSINTAIQSVPRSTDPRNLTWHEKILLYDPIVLEDLTDWLNAGPLEKAGFDQFSATIAVPVKKKDGTDSRGKNTYKMEVQTKEVSVKAGEVEPWMVQKWCQEMSVCCLWRESVWGGLRSRY